MRAVLLARDQISVLLEALLQGHKVFAPVDDGGVIAFRQVDSPQQVVLDYHNSTLPPKRLFFPQTETLFRYGLEEAQLALEEPPPASGEKVLFGVRPCDARSLTLLDRVFAGGNHCDGCYLARRENYTVVGLSCTRPKATCFCSSVGGGPFSTAGSDVLVTDLRTDYFIEAVTDKGAALVESLGGCREADEDSIRRRAEAQAAAEAALRGAIRTEDIERRLQEMWDDPFWDRLHEKCIGCGVCTYLCPTCHCFDIVDEGSEQRGRRLKIWDSCMFSLFTQHASGHNPRPTGKERWRQRLMHKFRYWPESHGEAGCVGCGRCVVSCPVNLDIRQVLNEIESLTKQVK
jgi:formate hydrogenlyase subunit 6/NADH:ubiquinone oxidoreductase subunit I